MTKDKSYLTETQQNQSTFYATAGYEFGSCPLPANTFTEVANIKELPTSIDHPESWLRSRGYKIRFGKLSSSVKIARMDDVQTFIGKLFKMHYNFTGAWNADSSYYTVRFWL